MNSKDSKTYFKHKDFLVYQRRQQLPLVTFIENIKTLSTWLQFMFYIILAVA